MDGRKNDGDEYMFDLKDVKLLVKLCEKILIRWYKNICYIIFFCSLLIVVLKNYDVFVNILKL